MATYAEIIDELTIELATVNAAIKRSTENGQGFKKGGVMGFSVDNVKMSELRSERTELKNRIITYQGAL